jgi:uncharacterized membrane protein YhaH (DUF805 family)
MAVGTSLVLVAVGAVLRFAVSVSIHGFNVHTIGVILMIVGGVGLLVSLLWMTMRRDRAVARPGYVDHSRHARRDGPPTDTY